MSSEELTAHQANNITNNATRGFEQKDLNKLEEIYKEIKKLAGVGKTQLRLDEKLQRDVLYRLKDKLDFRVVEFEDFGTEGDHVTLISWRDADLAQFRDVNFRGGGFPIA